MLYIINQTTLQFILQIWLKNDNNKIASPAISKMWSAFIVRLILPEIYMLSRVNNFLVDCIVVKYTCLGLRKTYKWDIEVHQKLAL